MTHTRDEIMVMTAEELRVAIGKREGYAWYESTDCAYFTKDTAILPGGLVGVETPSAPRRHVLLPCPDYPHDIAAAYQLLDEIAQDHKWDIGLYWGKDYTTWMIEVSRKRWLQVSDENLATAISRIWLIWSEESGK